MEQGAEFKSAGVRA